MSRVLYGLEPLEPTETIRMLDTFQLNGLREILNLPPSVTGITQVLGKFSSADSAQPTVPFDPAEQWGGNTSYGLELPLPILIKTDCDFNE